MRQAGLIAAREEGRWVYYKLDPQAFEQLRDWLNSLERLSQERAQGCS
jgi:ArsR family transcriptional regulator